MIIEKISISKLVSPEWNPRQITDLEMKKLKDSINEFGYVDPIIVNKHNNHIVGGNQRYLALKQLGYDEIDVLFINEPDINREKALNITLNNVSGDWNPQKLEGIFKELELADFDLKLTSFDDIQIEDLDINIDSELFTKNNETNDDEPVDIIEDEVEIIPEEELEVNVKHGDLFQLGNHYLLCGDATIESDVIKLVSASGERESMDLVFTDPPYGMKKEKEGVLNDNLNLNDLLDFNKKWIPLSFQILKSNGSWYCWGIDQPLMDIYAYILRPMIEEKEISFRNLITWDKGNAQGMLSPTHRKYPVSDEKCLFVMVGGESCQGFTVNADDYNENMDIVRLYLRNEIKKLQDAGLTLEQIGREALNSSGRMIGHYISKSQFELPTRENYEALRQYGRKILKQDYDFLKQDYDELKQEFYKNRSYFNNTHEKQTNVWKFPRSINTDDLEQTGGHATPKPILLCCRAIKSSSRETETVLDLFGGSGSTLIACEQLNRRCYMMELAPYYCQVIINRWENFTGLKAEKIT